MLVSRIHRNLAKMESSVGFAIRSVWARIGQKTGTGQDMSLGFNYLPRTAFTARLSTLVEQVGDIEWNGCKHSHQSDCGAMLTLRELNGVGSSLFATNRINKGEIILQYSICEENVVPTKDMHSIQIGKVFNWQCYGLPISFAQHALVPNTKFELHWDGQTSKRNGELKYKIPSAISVIAVADIEANCLVTVNYNSFEDEITFPFRDVETGRMVRGFKHVHSDERKILIEGDFLFPHLK